MVSNTYNQKLYEGQNMYFKNEIDSNPFLNGTVSSCIDNSFVIPHTITNIGFVTQNKLITLKQKEKYVNVLHSVSLSLIQHTKKWFLLRQLITQPRLGCRMYGELLKLVTIRWSLKNIDLCSLKCQGHINPQ